MKDLEVRLKGSFLSTFWDQLFSNAIQFPLPNILVEMLRAGVFLYWLKIDPYFLLGGAVLQAYLMTQWVRDGKWFTPIGNLIGVGLYFLLELYLDGFWEFLDNPNHRVYITFSLAICIIQFLEQLKFAPLAKLLVLVENMVRTLVVLAMYWVVEIGENPQGESIAQFYEEPGHIYITLALGLVGLAIGITALNSKTYLDLLRSTAQELQKYSLWLFGQELLGAVFRDKERLGLKRTKRSILFMDIRGFTAWAETRPPEAVVGLLNGYFAEVEAVWQAHHAIKVKHTADEIMVVFNKPSQAARSALEARKKVKAYLEGSGLAVGIGVHEGGLVEGLIGSTEVKVYDIIGDTVNTAKRLCDNAAGWEILLSEVLALRSKRISQTYPVRQITVKGKREPLVVYSL